MKRISFIIAALALVLSFTQCKKSNDTEPTIKGVKITLSVDDGSRADVNPGIGTVTFQNGDVIYVGSGGNYVGSLTRTSGVFTGNISDPVEGEPLYFYFLGNVTPTIDGNLFTVSISDQTSSLPVISCGTSTKNYSSTITSYSSKLMNKCALVKFNVTTSSSSATCINGFNNILSIDFSTNTTTPSKEGTGVIKLVSGNGEKWAVLLPQDALEVGETGSAYSDDGSYNGTRGAVPAITENGYYTDGIQVQIANPVLNHEYVDLGLPSGLLWATCNVGANAPEEYGDYFAWGETQPKSTYNWSTYQYCDGSVNTLTKYCNNSSYGYNGFTDDLNTLLPEDDAATANWGTDWRMPTKEEWQELLDNTTQIWMAQNGVNGVLFTSNNGNSLFLPSAGYRDDHVLNNAGSYGRYWSSSLNLNNPSSSWNLFFSAFDKNIRAMDRDTGRPIRPVHSSAPQNVPTGVINGKFSINSNGDQVYFSQGNLQYQASTNTWKFAENQYDYVGDANSNISSNYSGWIDLFGWGTSGYHDSNDPYNVNYQPWSTASSTVNTNYNQFGYGPSIQMASPNLTGSSANYDWGVYNHISNGGNQLDIWRTLTQAEWDYVFNMRNNASSIRYAKATVNGVNGVILLPDNWDPSYYTLSSTNNAGTNYSSNAITTSDWIALELHGAVFLPAGGERFETMVSSSVCGGYWSTSYYNSYSAYEVYITDAYLGTLDIDNRFYGRYVRLVRSAE